MSYYMWFLVVYVFYFIKIRTLHNITEVKIIN